MREDLEERHPMSIKNLRDKRVLVTGAASGIGRATAIAFAREGAELLLCDLDAQRLETVRGEVLAAGARCSVHGVDVSSEPAMRSLADEVHERGGALDVLVNNAGVAFLGSFFGSPTHFWHKTLGVNVMGVVHGTSFFGSKMHDAGGVRRIVNVASLAGIAPTPNMSSYAASKSAVIGLTEVLALELRLRRSGVGVTLVCPGIINTPITQHPANIAPDFGAAKLAELQAYYEATGVGPEVVADAIVAAVRSGRDLVLVGPFARLLYHLRRVSRSLLHAILLRDARDKGY